MVAQHPPAIKISIIVPVRNEAQNLHFWLDSLPLNYPETEWILVDGNSTDETSAILQSFQKDQTEHSSIQIIQSEPGRGIQMNAGAAISSGRILLFLHADTKLTIRHLKALHEISGRLTDCWGCFRFALDSPDWGFRILEFLVDARVRFFHLPFGDQALFVTKPWWNQIGPFKAYPFMEDFEWVRRYRQVAEPVYINLPVVTSARQWKKRGLIQNSARNLYIQFKYLTGTPPDQLSRLYYS